MKKTILAIILLAAGILQARSQIIISSSMFSGQMSTVRVTVTDSLTKEPIQYASVYLVAVGDTVITSFTLTDEKGKAELTEIPYGDYNLAAEFMGYQPVVKRKYLRNYVEDFGTLKMQIDREQLNAATITDVGNPIVIKQDTVEYTASSFAVGQNATLGDLIKKMPGFEVSEDGSSVKHAGKDISKITIGGRTFFMNDNSMALNNLPARVVDKVKVIDKDSDAAQASGMSSIEKETVMDIALKKEYEQGWFGNAGINAGVSIPGKEQELTPDNRDFVYNGNLMASGYNEKEQLTLIGNAYNTAVNTESAMIVVYGESSGFAEEQAPTSGINSGWSIGTNLNSQRMKGMELSASASYVNTGTDAHSKNYTTTTLEDGNQYRESENIQDFNKNTAKIGFELKNTGREKFVFELRPSFSYAKTDSKTNSASETMGLNTTSSLTTYNGDTYNGSAILTLGLKNLGKKGRNISLNGYLDGASSDAGSTDITSTEYLTSGTGVSRALVYDLDRSSRSLTANLSFVEPLGESWRVQLITAGDFSGSESTRDAFNLSSSTANDYYSTWSKNSYTSITGRLTAQYNFGANKTNVFQFGAQVLPSKSTTKAKSAGIESSSGDNAFIWAWSPFADLRYTKGSSNYALRLSGSVSPASQSNLSPALNISNPASISTGNIYLKSSLRETISGSWRYNNPQNFTTANVTLYTSMAYRDITRASWYDADGIYYSLPVNSRKPYWTSSFYGYFVQYLDKEKRLSLTLSPQLNYINMTSYQNISRSEGIPTTDFNYSDFMASFWGADADGDIFYNGGSGFSESRTTMFYIAVNPGLQYRINTFFAGLNGSIDNNRSRYSLDSRANTNTWSYSIRFNTNWEAPGNWELRTTVSWNAYRGYAAGYRDPYWGWNASVTKNIGAFSLSLIANDILASQKSLSHSASQNFVQDTIRMVIGRTLLFGVKYNFGKMNASQSTRAQRASLNMLF